MRTCVGCRERAARSDLLRVVAAQSVPGSPATVVPDPEGRRPGRGAYLHRDPRCFGLVVRRRALPRALRVAGGVDLDLLRQYLVGVLGTEMQETGMPSEQVGGNRPERDVT